MDLATILSRIEFGLSVGVHFIFPPTTLGLSLFILVAESCYLYNKKPLYRDLSSFAIRLLALFFALGVATGLTLPFTLGKNWAEFSKITGAIFGVQLAIEAVVAFTLESAFIGVLFFARDKVKKEIYWLSALLVFVGAHISAFIIIAANSWMQTPAGFHVDATTGTMIMDSWWAINFNPSMIPRFLHTVVGSWMVGAFLLVACAAWFLKKEKEVPAAKSLMTMAGLIALITAVSQPVLGHSSILQVREHQPIKAASLEGVFNDERWAPLYPFGWVDEENERVIGPPLPGALSFLYDFDFNSEIKGLNTLAPNKADRPPTQAVFQTFHAMVLAGVLAIIVIVFALWFHFKGTLIQKKKYLTVMISSAVLPYIGVEMGWFTAELGRQPWVIYPAPELNFGGLRTVEAVTANLKPEYALFSLTFFSLVYVVILFAFFRFLPMIIKKGIVLSAGDQHD